MSAKTVALCMLILTLAASQAMPQTELAWKWNDGEILKYVIKDTYTNKNVVNDAVFELNQSLILDTTWLVETEGNSGEAEVVMTIERVRFTADGKGAAAFIQKLTFDSKDQNKAASKPVFVALRGFVGHRITASIDACGRVTKFELPEALKELLGANTTRELAGFFGDVFTADGLRHRLTGWIVTFPEGPVPDGGTWRHEQVSRFGNVIRCVQSSTLSGPVKRDGTTLVKISVQPELQTAIGKPNKQAPKITDQQGEGVAYFDQQSGRIVDVVLSQHAIIESFVKMTVDSKSAVKLQVDEKK